MYPIYYAVVIILCIVALFATIKIALNLSKQEKEEYSKDDEIESLKSDGKNSSIPLLSAIYSVTFGLTAILVWIFIF